MDSVQRGQKDYQAASAIGSGSLLPDDKQQGDATGLSGRKIGKEPEASQIGDNKQYLRKFLDQDIHVSSPSAAGHSKRIVTGPDQPGALPQVSDDPGVRETQQLSIASDPMPSKAGDSGNTVITIEITSDTDSDSECLTENEALLEIINSQLSADEKQKEILSVIYENRYSDENFLKQIPGELWNKEIIIAACCDDPDTIDCYFEDFIYWTSVDLELIEDLIHAFRRLHQRKKMSCLFNLFKNLGDLDRASQSVRDSKYLKIPKGIWMIGCKYCPSIIRFLPERYLTREFLNLAKSAGGVTFDAARFPCATTEDVCLYSSDGPLNTRRKDTQHRNKLLQMKQIIAMDTAEHLSTLYQPMCPNPFSHVEVYYFTQPDRPVGRMSLTNRALPELFFTSFKHRVSFRPPRLDTGTALSTYIQTRCDSFDMASDIYPVSSSHFILLKEPLNVYGNRSIVVQKNSDQFLFFKFLREGEDIKQLAREMFVHEFIYENKSDNGKNALSQHQFIERLKSKTLQPSGLFKLADDSEIAREILLKCNDKLHIQQKENDKNYLIFYCFSSEVASYSQYANIASTDEERIKAEAGILTAAHDLGLWASAGTLYNTIIQPFHTYYDDNPASSRAWSFFHSERDTIYNETCSLPGKMHSWRSSIQKSDISIDGLRDLGDCVFFNKGSDNLQKEIMTMMQIIGNNFIALTLLWSDLNIDCLDEKKLEKFIPLMLDNFIAGYFPSPEKPCIAELLNYSPIICKQSLAVAAKEMVFWLTHKQGSLDEAGDLYPGEHDEFSQGDNLGVHEGLFPFTVLVKIITRLCTGIVKYSNQKQAR